MQRFALAWRCWQNERGFSEATTASDLLLESAVLSGRVWDDLLEPISPRVWGRSTKSLAARGGWYSAKDMWTSFWQVSHLCRSTPRSQKPGSQYPSELKGCLVVQQLSTTETFLPVIDD